MNHDLKIWTEYFQQIVSGKKTFEFRKNDRDFKVGDILTLWEFAKNDNLPFRSYTSHRIRVEVTSILLGGDFNIPVGYCIMSIKKLTL